MPERRRDRLAKGARRALEAAREAARRARGSAADATRSSAIDPSTPSTPPVERFTTARRMAERSEPPPAIQTTPPRPRRGENRLTPLPPELRIPGQSAAAERAPLSGDEAELIDLIDRLAAVADGSGLAEIEVSAAGTRVLVRSRAAIAGGAVFASIPSSAAPIALDSSAATAAQVTMPQATGTPAKTSATGAVAPSGIFVNAPLTGIFYAATSPGAEPLVKVGQSISIGEPIGLIEAMKLFNEIKSDKAGRVLRVIAESGRIVKSKTPIIELEP